MVKLSAVKVKINRHADYSLTRISLKKGNPRLNGSECCNISIQREFEICLSEVYQTTENLTPLHYKFHSSTPKIHKLELSEDLTIAPPKRYHWTKIYSDITLSEKLMVHNNSNINLVSDHENIKFVIFCPFVLKILNKKHILTSVTDRNSGVNLPKKTLYNLNIDLVDDNVYTKFG